MFWPLSLHAQLRHAIKPDEAEEQPRPSRRVLTIEIAVFENTT